MNEGPDRISLQDLYVVDPAVCMESRQGSVTQDCSCYRTLRVLQRRWAAKID